MKRVLVIGMLGLMAGAASAATSTKSLATLSSDELEIIDNGAQTLFRGNVRLVHEDYRMQADQMTRFGESGPVEARGRVQGTWTTAQGERVVATGGKARYDPGTEVIELWDKPQLRRYATAVDTAPVVIDAERFTAYRSERVLWAKRRVEMRQGEQFRVLAHEARYDQDAGQVMAWGDPRVKLFVADAKGNAAFESDRAEVQLDAREARLLSRVRGHVTPAP